MTTQYADSTHSLTSKSSKYNVYQTDGKPLSTEAIYRAKLKYGVYTNPAKISLGVDPSASDTAAILAANTDLSIHPYARGLSSEAAHAALIAKPDEIVRWNRESVAPEAEYAAISVNSLKFPFDAEADKETIQSTDVSEDQNAAAAASSVLNKKYSAKQHLKDLYAFDDVRSGKATLSDFSAKNLKSTKSLSTSKDYRSGIPTSNKAIEKSRKININGVTQSATKRANTLLNTRMTPEKDFRSGIKTSSTYTISNRDASIYITNIHQQAVKAKDKELNKKTTRVMGIETASDRGISSDPNKFAAATLKWDPSKEDVKSTIKDNKLVTQSLYAVASAKVNKDLEKLNENLDNKVFTANAKAYESAYKVASENAAKRKAKSLQPGEVNLGGGLKMKVNDINQIASSLVTPALTDLSSRISEMKVIDAEKKKLPAKIKQREAEFKEEQRQARIAVERKRAEEAKARRDQLEVDKKALDDELEQFRLELQAKYDEREEEFNKQVEQQEEEKKVIDEERASKLKVLQDAKAENDAERTLELEEMTKDKDDDLAPLLSELETEQSKLNELVTVREGKEAEYNEEKKKTDAINAELEDTLKQIEEMQEHIAKLSTGLEEISEKEAFATSGALESEARLEGEGKEKQAKLEPLEKEKEEHFAKRTELRSKVDQKADELKKLHQDHYNEEKDINEIYPEHLRKEVNVPEEFNDDDLNDSKFPLDETGVEIPPEIEEEPEHVPDEVRPKHASLEPEVVPETNAEERTATKTDGAFATAPVGTKQVVRSMVGDVKVTDLPVKSEKAKAKSDEADKAAKPSTKSAEKTAPKSVVKSNKNKNSGGILGFFKNKDFKNLSATPKPKPRPVSKPSTSSTKKSNTISATPNVTAKTTPAKVEKKPAPTAVSDETDAPKTATKPVKADGPNPNKTTTKVDDDVFSGFSQGSEVEA